MTEDEFEKVKQSEIIKFLPKRTPDGCVVAVVRYSRFILELFLQKSHSPKYRYDIWYGAEFLCYQTTKNA